MEEIFDPTTNLDVDCRNMKRGERNAKAIRRGGVELAFRAAPATMYSNGNGSSPSAPILVGKP